MLRAKISQEMLWRAPLSIGMKENASPTGIVVGSAPKNMLTRSSGFILVGRRNQNLFISFSIIDLKIQTCKVTYIKPAIPYAQHIPEHQTHESLQLYS